MSRLRTRDHFSLSDGTVIVLTPPSSSSTIRRKSVQLSACTQCKQADCSSSPRQRFGVNKIVFALIVIFSISSWIDIAGVFAQLPLMVPRLPESWALGAYFCFAMEVPFIAPAVIYLMIMKWPHLVNVRAVITLIIGVGALSLMLLAFMWFRTVTVNGRERSIPLLTLVACLGLVDSCSTIVFFPYMKNFHPNYMPALLVGESLTGFLPALFKIIQSGAIPYCENGTTSDDGEVTLLLKYTNPRFSVSIYFGMLSAIMVLCFVAFCLLEKVPSLKAMQISLEVHESHGHDLRKMLLPAKDCRRTTTSESEAFERKKLSKWEYFHFMFVMCLSAFLLWGLVSAFYTYSALPYGFYATNNAIIASNGLRFSAVFLAYKYPTKSIWALDLMFLALLGVNSFIMLCAVYSPCPPLVDTVIGAMISGGALIFSDYCSVYIRSCIIKIVSFHGGNILLTTAMVTKTGVMLGAVTSTILLQSTNFFKARIHCLPLSDQCQGFRTRFLPS